MFYCIGKTFYYFANYFLAIKSILDYHNDVFVFQNLRSLKKQNLLFLLLTFMISVIIWKHNKKWEVPLNLMALFPERQIKMAYLTIEIKSTPYSSLVKMLGPFVKSERLTKRNQWVHHFKNGELMQSYNSVCGIKVRGRMYYGQNHDVSATTQKYMGKWSGRSASQRRAELIDGTARMIDSGFNGYVSTSYSWGPKCSPMFSKRK